MTSDLEVGQEFPKCVATVLCESVVEDKLTSKKVLFGLFSNAIVADLPSGLSIFIIGTFSDGRGVWPLTCRVHDPEHRVVFGVTMSVNFANPLAVYDVVFRIDNLLLTIEGVYDVDLLINNDPIGHRSFRVEKV